MDVNQLEEREDWEELRARLGALLERRAHANEFDATSLAKKMGLRPRHIRQVFCGRRRSPDRYEHVARTLGWSLEDALLELDVDVPSPTPEPNAGADAFEADSEASLPMTLASTQEPSEPVQVQSPVFVEEPIVFPSPPESEGFEAHRVRLASELKARIAASHENQASLSKTLGVSQSVMSSLLAARHKRRGHYDALAGALGLEIDERFMLVTRSVEHQEASPSAAPIKEPTPNLPTQAVVVIPKTSSEVGVGSEPGLKTSSQPKPRLELDESTRVLIEWEAARRGMDPKRWLLLAVAAYHERHAP